MTASSRGSRAAASILRSTRLSNPLICPDCISHMRLRALPSPTLCRRTYAVAATSLKTLDSAPESSLPHLSNVSPISSTTPQYTPKAGILLSRAPILTAPQSPFEKAFYFYQKRLNERLAMPHAPYFYFKKDTPADEDRKIKNRERNGQFARELGGYSAYGPQAWNDELLSTESEAAEGGEEVVKTYGKMGIAEPKYLVDVLVKDARVRAVEGKDGVAVEVKEGEGDVELGAGEGKVEKPLSRFTESDRVNDTKRLDRKLTRTLYLVVKGKGKKAPWTFPEGPLKGRENLHQAAERVLVQSAGLNMNTWIVGRVPIGFLPVDSSRRIKSTPKSETSNESENSTPTPTPSSELSPEPQSTKTFFMKGRIMAGQADLAENMFGLEEYKWLTKEEVKKHVSARYWSYVQNMMADR